MKRVLLGCLLILLATSAMPQAGATGATYPNQTIAVGGGNLAVDLRTTIKQPPQLGSPFPPIPYPPQPSQVPLQCSGSNPLNGVDQRWHQVNGHVGHTATVTPTGTQKFLQDLDAYFFDVNCNYIDNGGDMGQGDDIHYLPPEDVPYTQFGDTETGVIPTGAHWMVVVLWAGANAVYTVSY